MGFLKKLFNRFISTSTDKEADGDRGQYLPEQILPVDEQFTVNFKSNGGKFLYCDTLEDLNETFINILLENDWFETQALTYEKRFESLLNKNNIQISSNTDVPFFLAGCESLIADDGSILFCDKQIKDQKINNLPKNIIIIAKTSQITRNKSDGLREIKKNYATSLPSNITAINCFKESPTQDFLSYGICPKNLYLLLLEDL